MSLQAATAGLIALGACALTACAHANGPSSGASTATMGVAAAMPQDRPSSVSVRADSGARAEAVTRFERHFEALSDACSAANWPNAELARRRAEADWRSIERVEANAGTPLALLDNIALNLRLTESVVARHKRRSCASEAAGLSLVATKLGPPMAPDEVHRARLRAWLRRVDTDAQYRDFDAASRDMARAEDEWRLLGASAGSEESTSTMEAALAAGHGAVDQHAFRPLRHAAHAALDALDVANVGRLM